jgi:hypothetical protein
MFLSRCVRVVFVALAIATLSGSEGVLLSLAPAAATLPRTTSGAKVVLGDNWATYVEGFGEPAPPRLQYGGDGYSQFTNIRWSNWGKAEATGIGRGWYVPGVESKDEGRYEQVKIEVFELGSCGFGRAYTGLTWSFPAEHQSQTMNPYLETCIGDYIHQGCDPLKLANASKSYLNSVDPSSKYSMTEVVCNGAYAISTVTTGVYGQELYYKRSGSSWVLLRTVPNSSGGSAVTGMPASEALRIFNDLEHATPLVNPVTISS